MDNKDTDFLEDDPIEQTAADWTVRIDRGLTAGEQDQYTEWLSLDSKHREAMAHFQWGWDEFDRLAGLQTSNRARVDPDLLAPDTETHRKFAALPKLILWVTAIPIAAVIILSFILFFSWNKPGEIPVKPAMELMARIEQHFLEDGSVVQLNRGAEISINYTSSGRRINLLKGEASFDVAKDEARPFIVRVGDVDVRVTGTVFNVNYHDSGLDVAVTEGKVGVFSNEPPENHSRSFKEVVLNGGQKGKIKFAGEADSPEIEIIELSQTELEHMKRWQPKLLDYDSTPLREIVEEFNKRNPIQIVLGDPSIEELRLSSSFWSDNVEGFVRLMTSSFGMNADWRGSREIVLYGNSD